MNVWLNTLGSVAAVSLVSLVGIVALARDRVWLDRVSFHLVSLAAGVLLGGAVVHLIPEAVEALGPGPAFPVWFLVGFLGFYLLERYLWTHHHGAPEGALPADPEVEEGHPAEGIHLVGVAETQLVGGPPADHGHWHAVAGSGPAGHPVVPMILIGDGIHNLIDGMLIAAAFLVDPALGLAVVVGVIAHEIPQELGDFGVLVHAGLTPKRALLANFASSTAAILGAILALALGGQIEGFANTLIAIAAGNFLYIAAADLIPELHRQRGPGMRAGDHLILIGGVLLMLGLRLVLG